MLDYYDREQVLWQLLWDGTLPWLLRRRGDRYGTVEKVIIEQWYLVIILERLCVIMVGNRHYGDYYGIERNICHWILWDGTKLRCLSVNGVWDSATATTFEWDDVTENILR